MTMIPEQTRINATIAYLFLGPFFLMAKQESHLGDTYVRMHAKKASQIIGVTALAILVFFVVINRFPELHLFGISSHKIILIAIMGACIATLLYGAYKAYQGESPDTSGDVLLMKNTLIHEVSVPSEIDRTRILASLLPFIGIFISSKYPSPLITHARIMSSCITSLLIVSVGLTGSESFLSFFCLSIMILIIIVEGIVLFFSGKFLLFKPLTYIPSSDMIIAGILATLHRIAIFVVVIFGKEISTSWKSLYQNERERISRSVTPTIPYFMPTASFGIPVWNLFTLPSLGITKYREYRFLIFQGFLLTVTLLTLLIFWKMYQNIMILLFLFPILHLIFFGAKNIMTVSPVFGWILEIVGQIPRKKHEKRTETVHFSYTEEQEKQ